MPHFRHRSVEFHCKSDRGVNIDLVREMLYSVEDLLSPEFGLSEGFAQSLRSFAHPIALAAGPLQMMKAEAELRFYVYRAIESKLPWPYIHKNRMTFVIRPSLSAVRGGF